MTDQSSKSGTERPDALRRKLTKGGLAAPVILATLASKPVLGAVPWTCTISGQLSGNTSGHESETCTTFTGAKTKAEWAGIYTPPHPDAAKKLSELFTGLADYIYTDGSNLSAYNTAPGSPGTTAASIDQILHLSVPTALEYGVKAVVLLLNAKHLTDTSNYPLTESQARGLYVSAANPDHPPFVDSDPDVTWLYTPDVISYINLLQP